MYNSNAPWFEPIWTTKDGTEIPIGQLTDSHLANCIRFMSRQLSSMYGGFSSLGGEMAQDCLGFEIGQAEMMRDALEAEAKRRVKHD